MKSLVTLLQTHAFIAATAFAAFIHSTWTLGTVFAGPQPEGDALQVIMWLLPAALIAGAIDIGQIQTASRIIHAKGRNERIALVVVFITLAGATYYLQWFHIAHHLPSLPFGDGVANPSSIQWFADAVLWIAPALLPMSTVFYTVSNIFAENEEEQKVKEVKTYTTDFLSANGSAPSARAQNAKSETVSNAELT